MAYSATGTGGNDTLDQSADTGPGTVVGLAGNDCIFTGSGVASVAGDSGSDTVILQSGNTGTVGGGFENDSIFAPDGTGSMLLLGGDGADTIDTHLASAAQVVGGGNGAADEADSIYTGTGADLVFGNGGNDTIHTAGGADTMIGGQGNDSFFDDGTSAVQLALGNQGDDTFNIFGGDDTVFGGQGNDCILDAGSGRPLYSGDQGNDTVDASANTGSGMTVVGGHDGADGADSILTGSGADWVFGNGGTDVLSVGNGDNVVIGGQGNDSILAGTGADLVFGNQGNDTVNTGDGVDTVFGGQGEDCIFGGAGAETFQGNEGNDTFRGGLGIDTISAGQGADVFTYSSPDDDGNNAGAGGPVEFLTDVNWRDDFVATPVQVAFAANVSGSTTGANLAAQANSAIEAVFALNGNTGVVAAQFTFGERTYLAIDQANLGAFSDTDDLLLDITGASGAIASGNFTT